jgi:predicted dehydrogenase
MRQVLQEIDTGRTRIREIPAPICGPREVLIRNHASLVSAGTERMVMKLAKRSLLGKARERPDQVRRVLQKMRSEGVLETLRQVRTKLSEPLSLGYSSAGVVLEVGREVRDFRPGDRVASNGPHAEVVAVPQHLVAPMPDEVDARHGCYAVVGAVALQGVRLATPQVGDRIAVIGLGLIGQITVQLLQASGCRVLATDPDPKRCELARGPGVEAHADVGAFCAALEEASASQGADAVLITASTSSNQPLELAAKIARRKARLIVVGAVAMDVPRRDFYPKELELVVSCSYGPGRYDPSYEDRGYDYPYGYVRWTEQRNIGCVLEQIAAGKLDVARLTSHEFSIEVGEKAYELLGDADQASLGLVLTYPDLPPEAHLGRQVTLSAARRPSRSGHVGVSSLGAGNFASLVLLPGLAKLPKVRLRAVCSARGVRATIRAERFGFELAATSAEELWNDPATDAVLVLTRHDLHAEQALAGLRAGKHLLVEKPLAIDSAQLDAFEEGLSSLGADAPLWMVGFNRRFAPATTRVRDYFKGVSAPLTLNLRMNAGPIPREHWTQDSEVGGGRLIGEACHFLDLAVFLTGARITRVFAESVAPGGSAGSGEDQAAILLRLDDGSIASVSYFAGGDKSFPKERIEVFGGGRVAVIDDFQSVSLTREGKTEHESLGNRDKGHHAELEAFLEAIRAGGPAPIPPQDLLNVSRATLAVVESLNTGLPVLVDTYR